MTSVLLRTDAKIRTQRGLLVIEPVVRRADIRGVFSKSTTQLALETLADPPEISKPEQSLMAVKHLEGIFGIDVQVEFSGPAVKLMAENNVGVSIINGKDLRCNIVPVSTHGSPEARIKQALEPPKISPRKKPALVRHRLRKHMEVLEADLRDLQAPLTSHVGHLGIGEIYDALDYLRDGYLSSKDPARFLRWYRSSLKTKPPDFGQLEPPTYARQIKRYQGLRIIEAISHQQILLSGLMPYGPGYSQTLIADISRELEPLVDLVLKRDQYFKSLLMSIDSLDMRKRILRGCMRFAKACRTGADIDKPTLVPLPKEL